MDESAFRAILAGLQRSGLTQAEAARKLGISRATLYRLRDGHGGHLHDTIRRIEERAAKLARTLPTREG